MHEHPLLTESLEAHRALSQWDIAERIRALPGQLPVIIGALFGDRLTTYAVASRLRMTRDEVVYLERQAFMILNGRGVMPEDVFDFYATR